MTIYLDMDGVVADTVKAACLLHNRMDRYKEWPGGNSDMYTVLGFKDGVDFWAETYKKDEHFWEHIHRYDWFPFIYEAICSFAPGARVVFLSKPEHNPRCAMDKVAWLQHRLGTKFDNYVLTRHKELLAHSDAILIDDDMATIDTWRKAGGLGILFPQPWNGQVVDDCTRLISVFTDLRQYTLTRQPRGGCVVCGGVGHLDEKRNHAKCYVCQGTGTERAASMMDGTWYKNV